MGVGFVGWHSQRIEIVVIGGQRMKTAIRCMAVAAGLFVAQMAMAQAAPAGSTGQCKDGTYTNAPSKTLQTNGYRSLDRRRDTQMFCGA